ncbi:MAG: hypothetical protein HYY23_01700 [Verrucomicrobia bacterium]|nr:hypothetical protein [Verrucomicrobiota bacterium]
MKWLFRARFCVVFAIGLSSLLRVPMAEAALRPLESAVSNRTSEAIRPRPALRYTGILCDLTIMDDGFFVLKDPASGERFVTRLGEFRIDAEGFLVSAQGFRVQGYNFPLTISERNRWGYRENTPVGDLKLDKGGIPEGLPKSAAGASVYLLTIGLDGTILIVLSDGTAYVRGQIVLEHFQKPEALVRRWQYSFNETREAIPSVGVGEIVSGALDSSLPSHGFTTPWVLLDRVGTQTAVSVLNPWSSQTELEASADLVHWTPILTNRPVSQTLTFRDPEGRHGPVRFYRSVSPVIRWTGVAMDLAISGDGFFSVKDVVTAELFVTRKGNFRVDANGFLVTRQGLRVQGFNSPPNGTDYSGADPIGDIKLDKGLLPASLLPHAAVAGIQNVSIGSSGKINILLNDGTQYVRGQILLQNFGNPFALEPLKDGLYTNLEAALPLPRPGEPDKQQLGRVESGALEDSKHTRF